MGVHVHGCVHKRNNTWDGDSILCAWLESLAAERSTDCEQTALWYLWHSTFATSLTRQPPLGFFERSPVRRSQFHRREAANSLSR